MEAKKPKDQQDSQIDYGHLCLREENMSFKNTYMISKL